MFLQRIDFWVVGFRLLTLIGSLRARASLKSALQLFLFLRSAAQFREHFHQIRQLIVCVQTTWVRQQPNPRFADFFRLFTHDSFRVRECLAISAEAEDRNHSRMIPSHFGSQLPTSVYEVIPRQLGSCRASARDDVGDSNSEAQELLFCEWRQQTICEP